VELETVFSTSGDFDSPYCTCWWWWR